MQEKIIEKIQEKIIEKIQEKIIEKNCGNMDEEKKI